MNSIPVFPTLVTGPGEDAQLDEEELPPTGGTYDEWSSHPFFDAHEEFDPALRAFSATRQVLNQVFSRIAKAVQIVDHAPRFFTEKRIGELARYLSAAMRQEPSSGSAWISGNNLKFPDGAKLELDRDERQGTVTVEGLAPLLAQGLTTFWRNRQAARRAGGMAVVRSISGQTLRQRMDAWKQEGLSTSVVTRNLAPREFHGVRPSETVQLLSQPRSSSIGILLEKPVASVVTAFGLHPLRLVDEFDAIHHGRWVVQASSSGALLSAPGAPDLNRVAEVHLVQAPQVRLGAIRLPPSGDVVLIVDEVAYRSCLADLWRLAQAQPRLRVFVPLDAEGSPVSALAHFAQAALVLLDSSVVAKCLHHLHGDVMQIEQTGRWVGPPGHALCLVSPKGGSDAGRRCDVWHLQDPQDGARMIRQALGAFRFLPPDFAGAEAFWLFCLIKAGMAIKNVSPSHRCWSTDPLLRVEDKGDVGNRTGPDVFENTYGQSARLVSIVEDIRHRHPGSDKDKAWACESFTEFFGAKQKHYAQALGKTVDKVSRLSQSEVDEGRVAQLVQKVEQSRIRQALYDQMNGFSASDDRVLFVTAPCGVGKTLALSLLSARRDGRAAWFSFPTNQLAKEFANASPSRTVSVHCEGDVKGSELHKLEAHAVSLETAAFVHPTMLHAIKGGLKPSTFDGLTLFVDEWHNLSDDQLRPLQALLKDTNAKLVLLSATPRREQCDRFKDLYPHHHRVHEIAVDVAQAEGLLRSRLVFDGTGAFFVRTKKSGFEARFERAQAALEVRIHGQALWLHSGVIYVDDTEQAKEVCAALRKPDRYRGLMVFDATGQRPDSPDFTRTPFVLVCCKRYREGANIPALNYVLALGSLNDTAAIQIGGRLSRKFKNGGGLPYGLLFAFGHGSGTQSTLRSDRGASMPWDFLEDCHTREGKPLIDEFPMLPPVRPEIFKGGELHGNRFSIDLHALPGRIDAVESASLLGRKRAPTDSVLSWQGARGSVSSWSSP